MHPSILGFYSEETLLSFAIRKNNSEFIAEFLSLFPISELDSIVNGRTYEQLAIALGFSHIRRLLVLKQVSFVCFCFV